MLTNVKKKKKNEKSMILAKGWTDKLKYRWILKYFITIMQGAFQILFI